MSLSFSSTTGREISLPVSPLSYRDVICVDELQVGVQTSTASAPEEGCEAQMNLLPQELEQILSVARLEAAAEAERKIRLEMEEKLAEENIRITHSIEGFTVQRKQYFAHVEGEVIRLALAVAAKILHREAQVDSMLIAAMVRISLDKIQDSSSVSIRVPMTQVAAWEEHMNALPNGVTAEIIGDSEIGSNHCIVQAELGTVDFNIDSQLKEVEQGFFDLLAQRPGIR